jgi:hypothetical protein
MRIDAGSLDARRWDRHQSALASVCEMGIEVKKVSTKQRRMIDDNRDWRKT